MKPTEQIQPFTGYQKIIVLILALLQFTVVLDFMIMSPMGDLLIKALSISTKQFGWAVSAYAFAAFASGVLAAGFADKFDRKKMLMFFYVGFVLGTLFCGLAATYHQLLAARIVTGIFGGVISSISMAIVTDLFAINQRGRVMGTVQMAFAASQVLGIPIGIFIATKWDWHAPFFMLVGLAAVIGILVVLKMKPVVEHLKLQIKGNPFMHLYKTFTNKTYQVGFMSTAMLSIGGFMLMPFSSAFLVNNIKIDQAHLPLVFMFTGISSIVIMPLVGRLCDRYDKYKIFLFGSLLAVVMVIIYTHLTVVPLWVVIVVNMVLFMGIMSRMIPSTTLNTAIPEMRDRGAFMSINASLQQVAGGVAAVIAGMIVKQESKTSPIEHFDILGYIVSAVIIICLFFVYRVYKLVKDKQAAAAATAPIEH